MWEVMAIVLGVVVLAALAAVPLVLLLHAVEQRQPVKEVTPSDRA
ncbi:hypothetical protein KIPE111705_16835 [Kibdelosporangium persicum]|nr:hypothetical protein [Kibdelosporangium persicum]